MAVPDDLDRRIDEVDRVARELRLGRLDEVKETSFHAEFAGKIFADALDYQRRTDGEAGTWELDWEATIPGTGQEADLGLGLFDYSHPDRIIVPVELKGAKQSLDRRGSRRRTPVEQARDYAAETPGASWYVVSNYREIRLYHLAHVSQRFERFDVERLTERDEFLRFYLLLGRDSLLPARPGDKSHLDLMLEESVDVERELTDELYDDYSTVRYHVFQALRDAHAERDPRELLRHTQKLLDRILFVAFAEDRDLLPRHTLKNAFQHEDPYKPRPKWENFKAIFRAIDEGNDALKVPAYNGGLFAPDPALETLDLSDEVCEEFAKISEYDFEGDVSVTVLGHIFEQSITDLEEMREEIEDDQRGRVSKRKKEGVYYTPDYVTRFIVEAAIGAVLDERRQACFERVFASPELKGRHEKTKRIAALKEWQKELPSIRIIDPACGSGAFLIAAFDYLSEQYEEVATELAELEGGQPSLLNWNDTILRSNLFGVDLNPESVEITRLSLWLKTVKRGETLTALDDNIRVGNSVVGDPDIDPRAFDWSGPFEKGDFDVVIGNPPYVRHELLGEAKSYFKDHYQAYAGTADLYVYFYELGLQLLKPDGRLSYIVTNKWLRSGYGEGIRRLFANTSVLERIVDFGHAPIFEDADTFPCIIVSRKAASESGEKPEPDAEVEVCEMPRDELKTSDIATYCERESHRVPWARFSARPWSLERVDVLRLMERLREVGVPLAEYLNGAKPYSAVKTGCNAAYIIDQSTRDNLVAADASAAEVIEPYARGHNIKRWSFPLPDEFLITIPSSGDHVWPWSDAETEESAENIFEATYPSVLAHLKSYEKRLRKRTDQGEFWWELRSCSYYDVFEKPNLMYPDIAWTAEFAFGECNTFCVTGSHPLSVF